MLFVTRSVLTREVLVGPLEDRGWEVVMTEDERTTNLRGRDDLERHAGRLPSLGGNLGAAHAPPPPFQFTGSERVDLLG